MNYETEKGRQLPDSEQASNKYLRILHLNNNNTMIPGVRTRLTKSNQMSSGDDAQFFSNVLNSNDIQNCEMSCFYNNVLNVIQHSLVI